jgi:hypothetical protein
VVDSPNGPLAPSLVVARLRTTTVDVPEHRRIARFLGRLWHEVDSVARSGAVRGEDLADLQVTQRKLGSIVAGTFFSDLAALPHEDLVLEASHVEREDRRYRRLHELRVHYLTEVVPTADSDQLGRQMNARPDEVYQALCTLLLAAAFDLSLGRDAAGRECYLSHEWILYSNRVGAVTSWRTASDRPDDYRPDLVLVRRDDATRCVLLDAKAAVDGSGRVPGERLKEVQAYLNAFGVRRAGVLYPGSLERSRTVEAEDITGHGYLLRELPVRAVEPGELPLMLENLRARVLELEDKSDFAEDS